MNVGLFTYSTKPRGGVVHTLELGRALHDLGHVVTVTALDESGAGFFRSVPFATRVIPVAPHRGTTREFVRDRIATYVEALHDRTQAFQVYHAHDGISANALATLRAEGAIPGFVRTVHHLDDFEDAELLALQDRSVLQARACFVVSELWQRELQRRFGTAATVVPSGVDTARFRRPTDAERIDLRKQFGYAERPTFLAIGGVEERKNTLGILDGFARVRERIPSARLVIVGGSSVLDHRRYSAEFDREVAAYGLLVGTDIDVLGAVDDTTIVQLLQACDALVFPSLREGFGLVILEALACGTPVITSAIEPFTSYLAPDEALFCDPLDAGAIAGAMTSALEAGVRERFRVNGPFVARRFDWQASARAHLPIYQNEKETDAGNTVPRALAG